MGVLFVFIKFALQSTKEEVMNKGGRSVRINKITQGGK